MNSKKQLVNKILNSVASVKATYLIAGVIACLCFYVLQVNFVTLKGYKLEEKQLELVKLKESHDDLIVKEAMLRSLSRIENGVSFLELEVADNTVYIDPAETEFAKR